MWYPPPNVNNPQSLPVKVVDYNHHHLYNHDGRNRWTKESMEQWSSTQSSIYSQLPNEEVDWASLAKQWIAMQQNQVDPGDQNEPSRCGGPSVFHPNSAIPQPPYHIHGDDQGWRRNNSPHSVSGAVPQLRVPFKQNPTYSYSQSTSQFSTQTPSHATNTITPNHGYSVDVYQSSYQMHGQSMSQHTVPPPVLTPDPSIIAQQYPGQTFRFE